jgi:hypothetical protein
MLERMTALVFDSVQYNACLRRCVWLVVSNVMEFNRTFEGRLTNKTLYIGGRAGLTSMFEPSTLHS